MSTNCQNVTCGLDVGFGNGKCVAQIGDAAPVSFVLPVGAAPADRAGKDLNGATDFSDGVQVTVDKKPWIAGVDPTRLQGGFARQTHDTYVTTKEYLALALALMAKMGVDHIDHLVTGLPCSDFLGSNNRELRGAIVNQLAQDHQINSKQRCHVKNVYVVAQPLGAYFKMMHSDPAFTRTDDALTLVCDIGYGTADWCVLQAGKLWDKNSGSSADATSQILRVAAEKITRDNPGTKLSQDRLESLYRRNVTYLDLGGRSIPYQMYLEAAAADISRRVMAAIASSMRTLRDPVTQVLLTGGGARLYESAARETFSSLRPECIKIDADSVLGNAMGFQIMAVDALNQSRNSKAA